MSNLKNKIPKKHKYSRGNDNKKPKKLSVKQMGKNTMSSLNDVEKFLGDFKRFSWYMKFYKLFK